jgi:hypothetical protein
MSTQTEAEIVNNLATTAHDFVSQVLIGLGEPVMPTIVIEKEDGNVEIIGCPWRDDAEKKAMVTNAAMQIGRNGGRAWSFVCEAWTATQKPDKRPFVRPRDRPDRKEAVFCLIGTGGETIHIWSWEIIRGEGGKCERLGALASDPPGMESWIGKVLNAGVDYARGDR